MMFAAALFDLDGLLLDTEAVFHAVDLEVLTAHGADPEEARAAVDAMVGQDETACRAIRESRFPTLDFDAVNADCRVRIDAIFAKGIPVCRDVIRLLDALDAHGIPKAVATNSSKTQGWRKLGLGGLEPRFDVLIGYDMVAAAKPAPDIFVAAAEALGQSPAQCIAFEDSDTGALAARRAGCTVVQVPNLQRTPSAHADFAAETVWEGALAAGLNLDRAPVIR
ncbi:MAG: HAD-IA family hydrolase [Oceanicola sp.]|nr:HAD-IA family hydrolase [Oceanicola sp.]